MDLIRREPGGLEAAEALRVVDERLYGTAERLQRIVRDERERERSKALEARRRPSDRRC